MTRRLILVIVLNALTLSVAAKAGAQTISNGPYYATPSWDETLPCPTTASCPRFIVLSNFNNLAVLDRETGLVWQQNPVALLFDWVSAQHFCSTQNTGDRFGWRLPALPELISLSDAATLPAGHPFSNIETKFRYYWSSTSVPGDPNAAWDVAFLSTNLSIGADGKTSSQLAWCVRGGVGVNSSQN